MDAIRTRQLSVALSGDDATLVVAALAAFRVEMETAIFNTEHTTDHDDDDANDSMAINRRRIAQCQRLCDQIVSALVFAR
jgi:hypothetical protein